MMDTQQMIELAKEREGWKVWSDTPILGIRQHGMIVADYVVGEHANFIALAPRTILALAEENARLQARCVELERDSADTLIEDLEQDVIAEMHSGEGRVTRAEIAWNQALDWVLERLKTYRKE